MRASRLVELLVRLQLRGSASASELASALEVSVRTIYRDIEALSAAGVPVYTEVGRNGGVRIDPAYRIARLPRLDVTEARSVLFAIVPALAEQLGLDAESTERTLLPALERSAENAARVVQQRLLVEPSHWFLPTEEAPVLADVATAVWESREIVIAYRGERIRAQPLGLILKGDRWYLLGRAPGRHGPERVFRLFRLSRAENVEVLDHRFDCPAATAAAARRHRTRRARLGHSPAEVRTARAYRSPTPPARRGRGGAGSP